MYAAPPRQPLAVFAAVPERFHATGRRSTWVDVQLHGAPTPAFLEGPAFDAGGRLWLVDIPYGRLFTVDDAGRMDCALEYDGEPNGLAFHPDGRLFIADNKNGLMVFDPRSGGVEPFLDRALVQRFKGLNDLVFATNGDLYFTDQGQTGHHDPSGRLYRLTAAGRLDALLTNVPSPNGLVLNATEDQVWLAATRANAIWRVPLVHRHGLVTKVGTWLQLSGGGGPDGLALTADGGLVVCHVGLGAVWCFDTLGQPVLRLDAPAGLMTTNAAFGGPGLRRLYVTCGSEVLVAELPFAGAPTAAQRAASTAAPAAEVQAR